MKASLNYFAGFLLLISLVACTGSNAQLRNRSMRQKIAEAYGIEHFGQVDQIQYTFNVQKGETLIRRFWIWEPKMNKVTFKGMNAIESITYDRNNFDDASPKKLKEIDAWFVNDNYWFLFPFHLVWDSQTTVQDIGRKKLPMGAGKARCVVVTYPGLGGYTPGDVYELYLDESFRLIQWVYRRGGAESPSRIATWEDHRKVGPLTLALSHRGADENFRIWFTTVGIKMAGSSTWIFAQYSGSTTGGFLALAGKTSLAFSGTMGGVDD